MSGCHAPVVTDEPLHGVGTHHFRPGKLERFGEWLDDVATDVVHATLLDESIKKLQEVLQLPHGDGSFRSSWAALQLQRPLLQELPQTLGQRGPSPPSKRKR